MQASKFVLWGGIGLAIAFTTSSCKKTIVQDKVYDNVIYDLGNQVVYTSASQKAKQKTATQYLSILYANLKQTTIPNNELTNLSQVNLGFGDKGLVNEILVSHYMNNPGVVLPTAAYMRSNLDQFITDTYIRFYQRKPTSYELYGLRKLITDDPNMTPELVYSSFALSDEYWFY